MFDARTAAAKGLHPGQGAWLARYAAIG